MDSKSKTAIIGAIIAAAVIIGVVVALANSAEPAPAMPETLIVYSGRSEALVAPIIERFKEDTGINVEVRYGGTSPMALLIIEEGRNSPADVFFSQDAGALGELSKKGLLARMPNSIINKVDPYYASESGDWVGVTARARVIDYNTQLVDRSELPDSIWGLLDPKWKGKVGWSPANASFQSFITAMRVLEGDDRARQWLQGMIANEAVTFPGNGQIVEAVARGEISLGLVNNYYLHGFQRTNPAIPVAHHYTTNDAGSLVNIAGMAVVNASDNKATAQRFIEYMLEERAQMYFSSETYEIPLTKGMPVLGPQLPLDRIDAPELKLADIDDLQGTLDMLREVGAL